MSAYTPKVGHVVEVTFLDHASGSRAPLLCRCYGRIETVTTDALCLRWWEFAATELQGMPNETDDHNPERVTVVRSAVTAMRRLG